MQFRTLAKTFAALALSAGALGATSAAHAGGHVSLAIGVGVPLASPVYVQPAPVYVQPAPAYSQPQVVYTQPQVVYSQPQVVYAPAPVYYRPAASVVIGGPIYRSGWHGHGREHGHGHRGHWR